MQTGRRERERGRGAARRDDFERIRGRGHRRAVIGQAVDVGGGREHGALLGGVAVAQVMDAVIRGLGACEAQHQRQRGRPDATVAPERPCERQPAKPEQQDEQERGGVPVMMRTVRAGGRGGEQTRGIRQVSEHHGPNHTLVAHARNCR